MLFLSSETYSTAPNKKYSSYMSRSSLYNKISKKWSSPKKKKKNFTVSGFVFGADSRWATLSEVMDDLAQLLPSRLPPEHEAVPANAGKRCHLCDGKRKAPGGEEEWDTRRRRQRRRRRRRRCEGVWTSSPSDSPPFSSALEGIQPHLRGSKWAGVQSPSSFLGLCL